jgi:hypothetical protein
VEKWAREGTGERECKRWNGQWKAGTYERELIEIKLKFVI